MRKSILNSSLRLQSVFALTLLSLSSLSVAHAAEREGRSVEEARRAAETARVERTEQDASLRQGQAALTAQKRASIDAAQLKAVEDSLSPSEKADLVYLRGKFGRPIADASKADISDLSRQRAVKAYYKLRSTSLATKMPEDFKLSASELRIIFEGGESTVGGKVVKIEAWNETELRNLSAVLVRAHLILDNFAKEGFKHSPQMAAYEGKGKLTIQEAWEIALDEAGLKDKLNRCMASAGA